MAKTSSFRPSEQQNIALRRLTSSTSTKNSFSILTNPFSDTNSITSTLDSANSLLPRATQESLALAWKADRIFRIDTLGKRFIGLPTPVKELVTPIILIDSFADAAASGDGGGDGVREGEMEVYRSVRPELRSGSCYLLKGESEVASTTYLWGPGRDPVVRIADEEFGISRSSIWNRTHGFVPKRWGKFEWRYAGREERKIVSRMRDGKDITSLLVLEHISKLEGRENRHRVAMLIRGDGTRTEGTGKRDAGNGGVLEVCMNGGGEEGNGDMVDEVTVLVTALVMLKKEVDRYRTRTMGLAVGVTWATGVGT